MCEATLVLTAVGTAFSAYSQMQQASYQADVARVQGENQRRIAEYNAQVAENNAAVVERNADRKEEQALDAIRRGADEAAQIRERVRKINATGRAIQGSSGLLVDEGNFSDVLDQNTVFGEVDALQTVNNAEREAYGFRMEGYNLDIQANDIRNQAQITRTGGQIAVNNANAEAAGIKQAGLLNTADTLVSGGVNFGKLGGFKKIKEFGK